VHTKAACVRPIGRHRLGPGSWCPLIPKVGSSARMTLLSGVAFAWARVGWRADGERPGPGRSGRSSSVVYRYPRVSNDAFGALGLVGQSDWPGRVERGPTALRGGRTDDQPSSPNPYRHPSDLAQLVPTLRKPASPIRGLQTSPGALSRTPSADVPSEGVARHLRVWWEAARDIRSGSARTKPKRFGLPDLVRTPRGSSPVTGRQAKDFCLRRPFPRDSLVRAAYARASVFPPPLRSPR
jgi:hypothetical protein